MPDWKPSIRECLGDLSLRSKDYDELIEELCAHLDERFAELQSDGFVASRAKEICMEEINALREERTHIEHAKGDMFHMNSRTKTLWLPGFVSASASSLVMMAIGRNSAGMMGDISNIYVIWLALLPLCGAAGALLSRKWNGTISARLTSALFPSLVMAGAFLLTVPFDILINRNGYIVNHPKILLQAFAMWVFAPAVALLVGSAPLCREKHLQVSL